MEEQTYLSDYDREFSWHDYNKSQTKEKALFFNILGELCDHIEEKSKETPGRKPRLTKDIVFSLVLKQYLNTSARRVQSDLKLSAEAGFISEEIPFNTLLDHLRRKDLKHVLKELIEISSLPLKQIEFDFAPDSTGFSSSRYVTFFDYKHKKDKRQNVWRKCHAVCGVKTNIVTAVYISDGYAADQNFFEDLARDTAKNFAIRDFCADKGYLSGRNFALIKYLGGNAFIPFKKNTTANSHSRSGYRSYFKSAYHFFKENREEYLKRYHKRSNIESTFSMIKRKFGNNIRCKNEVSQDNEILAKILAHNICVLIQEIFLNKVNVNFTDIVRTYRETPINIPELGLD